jgi:hypothetical protein
MEYYSAIKKNGIMPFAEKWMKHIIVLGIHCDIHTGAGG